MSFPDRPPGRRFTPAGWNGRRAARRAGTDYRWPFAPPPEPDPRAGSGPAWQAGSAPWVRSIRPLDNEQPRRWGPPRAVTLWVPVVLSFLVQVVPAVVALNRGGRTGPAFVVVLLALVGPLALIAARRFPGPVVAIATAAAVADLLFTPGSGAPYLALAFAIVSAMVRSARTWALASVATGWLLTLVGAILLGIEWHPFRIIATSLGILIVVLIGEAIRTRTQRVAQFQAALRRRREEAAQAERERIARELHDVLAHSLSQINVQAAMGLHLIDAHPEKAREALGNIKATSKTALDEVRGVLGFLRAEGSAAGTTVLDDAPTLFDYSTIPGEAGYGGDVVGVVGVAGAAGAGAASAGGRGGAVGSLGSALASASQVLGGGLTSGAPLAPQADLSRLPALVSSLSTSEFRVELHNRLDVAPPPGIQLALFRIAQESLTNVTRHAGATEARVVLEQRGDDYVLRVSDNGRGGTAPRATSGRNPGGRGLLGMKERAELLGGHLEAGPISTGGFAVVATVPRVPRAPRRSRP
ncbi:sensor histidine kinase [Subtercola boreus]|nr:sensor histidine kinase [Subtercola boreus]